MTFTLVPVTRTYLDGSGNPRSGTVRLQLVGALYNNGEIADRKPQIATLDAQGRISLSVRATDDPDTLPAGGGTYEVTEALSGLATVTYFIAAPYDGGPIDLATAPRLAEAAAPAQLFQSVNQRNLPNGYAGLDGSGRVPLDQLPANLGTGGGGTATPISGDDTDIQALGNRAAGASGKAADARHVHQMPLLHQVGKPTADLDLNGRRIKNAADGISPQDYATVAQLGQSVLGIVNVKDKQYGAKADGTSDDWAAIQAAIDAAPDGAVVYLPQGIYRISQPLKPRPSITLRGAHSNMMAAAGLVDPACYIQPLDTFTGSALLVLQDQAGGAYAGIPAEHRFENLMLDASNLDDTKPVDGIYAAGNIQNVVMRDVTIRRMSNNGIVTAGVNSVFPYSWRLHSVMIDNCRANGVLFTRMTDLTMIDCQVIGCWATGYQLTDIANSTLSACRAEWNGNYGIHITGAWGNGTGSGGAILSACSTDRNGWDGVNVDGSGNGPITISALTTRRDGRNGGSGGGGYAGLAVKSATLPVIADGVTCYPGTDDDGTGAPSPDYGASVLGSTSVQISGAYLHGFLGGLHDDGTNISLTVASGSTLASGPTTSPARNVKPAPVDWLNVKTYSAKGDGTSDDTAAIQAAVDAASSAGGTVYIPGGTYRLTDQIVVHNGVSIVGDGPTASVLQQTSATAHGIYGKDLRHVSISSLGVTGPGPASGTMSGIYLEPVDVVALNYVSMRDLRVQNFGGDGIHVVRTIVSVFDRILAATNGGYGISLPAPDDTGAGGTSCVLNACYGNGNLTGGFRIHRMSYTSLNGCAADSSPVGYQIDLSYGVTLNGCGAEDCVTGIEINGGGGNLITGGVIYASRGTCVHITGGATGCGVAHLVEVAPNTASGALKCIKTETGTHTVVTAVTSVKAMDYATGTVQVLDDSAGAAIFNGLASFANGIQVTGTSQLGYTHVTGVLEADTHIVTDGGNISISGVGKGLLIAEGTNARMGVATLTAGTVTVANTSVTDNTRIAVTRQMAGGTLGHLSCTRTAGASFTITSDSSTETSTVFWMLLEPA
jgi:hypothetical protein